MFDDHERKGGGHFGRGGRALRKPLATPASHYPDTHCAQPPLTTHAHHPYQKGILRSIILAALAPHRLALSPDPPLPPPRASLAGDDAAAAAAAAEAAAAAAAAGKGASALGGVHSRSSGALAGLADFADLGGADALEARATDERSAREELRCVLAVVRHGGERAVAGLGWLAAAAGRGC